MTAEKTGTVELTDEQRAAFKDGAGTSRNRIGFWFVCSACGNMHQWRGGPIRCYNINGKDDAPVAAGVVCKCGSGFCPAHGK